MVYLLCRNRVKDYDKWKTIFDTNLSMCDDAGLKLTNLWRDIEEPNNVFFMFEVINIEKARAMLNDPNSAETGEISGVIDGEVWFVE